MLTTQTRVAFNEGSASLLTEAIDNTRQAVASATFNEGSASLLTEGSSIATASISISFLQ